MNGLAALWRPCALSAWLAATLAGCASPLATGFLSGSRQQEAQASTATSDASGLKPESPQAAALRKATGRKPATHEEALAGVLDDLQKIGAIDPAAQQQLMSDLKAAKPEHYGLMVEQFQSALAYRQQLAERDLAEAAELATDKPDDAAELATHQATRPAAAGPQNVRTLRPDHLTTRELPSPAAPAARATAATQPTRRVSEADSRYTQVVQASHSTELTRAEDAADWQARLNETIESLEKEVSPQPRTVAELHEHMRLRTLQLLGGRQEDAFRPIPGTSPSQQDFWSKQLFAISAYLDGDNDLDDKQRAAAALTHLDEARAALSDQATLQIRNFAFVKSVDGFGAYEPLEQTKFKPGDQAAIYAEVENFRSDGEKDGYRTVLATSYQVLDKSGRRVEGGQFPEVSDVCRSRRRDFHMQYGVALPTRIYSGEYELELVLTDQQSGKIGRASLPFEIVAER